MEPRGRSKGLEVIETFCLLEPFFESKTLKQFPLPLIKKNHFYLIHFGFEKEGKVLEEVCIG